MSCSCPKCREELANVELAEQVLAEAGDLALRRPLTPVEQQFGDIPRVSRDFDAAELAIAKAGNGPAREMMRAIIDQARAAIRAKDPSLLAAITTDTDALTDAYTRGYDKVVKVGRAQVEDAWRKQRKVALADVSDQPRDDRGRWTSGWGTLAPLAPESDWGKDLPPKVEPRIHDFSVDHLPEGFAWRDRPDVLDNVVASFYVSGKGFLTPVLTEKQAQVASYDSEAQFKAGDPVYLNHSAMARDLIGDQPGIVTDEYLLMALHPEMVRVDAQGESLMAEGHNLSRDTAESIIGKVAEVVPNGYEKRAVWSTIGPEGGKLGGLGDFPAHVAMPDGSYRGFVQHVRDYGTVMEFLNGDQFAETHDVTDQPRDDAGRWTATAVGGRLESLPTGWSFERKPPADRGVIATFYVPGRGYVTPANTEGMTNMGHLGIARAVGGMVETAQGPGWTNKAWRYGTDNELLKENPDWVRINMTGHMGIVEGYEVGKGTAEKVARDVWDVLGPEGYTSLETYNMTTHKTFTYRSEDLLSEDQPRDDHGRWTSTGSVDLDALPEGYKWDQTPPPPTSSASGQSYMSTWYRPGAGFLRTPFDTFNAHAQSAGRLLDQWAGPEGRPEFGTIEQLMRTAPELVRVSTQMGNVTVEGPELNREIAKSIVGKLYDAGEAKIDGWVIFGIGPETPMRNDSVDQFLAESEGWGERVSELLAGDTVPHGTVPHGTAQHADRPWAALAEQVFGDVDQPRDERGRWTSGDSYGEMNAPTHIASGRDTKMVNHLIKDYALDSPKQATVERGRAKNEIAHALGDRLESNPAFLRLVDQMSEKGDLGGAYDSAVVDTTNVLVDQWSSTSGDSNGLSCALQQAVKDEFGIAEARVDHLEGLRPTFEQVARGESASEYEPEGLRAFARAMYENTQETLAAQGFGPDDKVALWRGMGVTADADLFMALREAHVPENNEPFELPAAVITEVAMQPASSWSVIPDEASEFASYHAYGEAKGQVPAVLLAEVPRTEILSTARTGWGCLTEGEVTVLGHGGEAAVFPWNRHMNSTLNAANTNDALARGVKLAEWYEGDHPRDEAGRFMDLGEAGYAYNLEGAINDQTYTFAEIARTAQGNPSYASALADDIGCTEQQVKDNDPAFRDALLAYGKRELSDASIIVHVPESVLGEIVRDGRLENQFMSQASQGLYDPERRTSFEAQHFNVPSDTKPEDRPIYGALAWGDRPVRGDEYGSISIVLKDNVRERTTYTLGDSLDEGMVGNSLSNPNPDIMLQGVGNGGVPDGLVQAPDFGYTEAQVHGGVTLGDVKAVYGYGLEADDSELADAIEGLKAAGVPFYWSPSKPELVENGVLR